MEKRELVVRRNRDGFIARRVDVTGRSDQEVDRVLGGMLINADTGNWIIFDTKDGPLPPPPLPEGGHTR